MDGTGGGSAAASVIDGDSLHTGLSTVTVSNGHTVTQVGGSVTPRAGEDLIIGSAGTATWNISGGTVGAVGDRVLLGNAIGAAGYLMQSGGTVSVGDGGDGLHVGNNGAGTAHFDGGTAVLRGNTYIGRNAGADGYVEIDGGSVTVNTAGNIFVGHNIGATGSASVVLNSGTLNLNNINLHSGFGSLASTGFIEVNGGTLTSTGGASRALIIGSTGTATLDINGGTLALGSQLRLGGANGGAGNGYVDMSGGVINATENIRVGHAGSADGTFNLTGGTINLSGTNGSLNIGLSGGATGEFNQSGGTVNTSLVRLQSAGAGTYNMDGGRLNVNAIDIQAGNVFEWSGGTISTFSNGASGAGGDQSSPGFNEVLVGQTLAVTGSISSDAGGSTLDLGEFYINSGVRFNQMTVSGTLDLGDVDTLEFSANPYLLRPNVGLAEEYGSIPLVTAGSITGSFDTWNGPLQDVIGWTEYTGVFVDAENLPLNTYYLEQTGTAVTFHYKVEGTVPEPGTVGLLGLGILLIRRIRSLQRGRSLVAGSSAGAEAMGSRGFYE